MSEKNMFGYIFPALGGLFVTCLYNVVDGIFVGQGVGAAALGAVNIGCHYYVGCCYRSHVSYRRCNCCYYQNETGR